MKRFALVTALAFVSGACSPSSDSCSGWSQWSQGASHSGQVCVAAQSPARILSTVEVDPFAGDATLVAGDLLVHYQVPLAVGDDVYSLHKLGAFTQPCDAFATGNEVACHSWDSQIWTEERRHWSDGKLEFVWSAGSDWKPVPSEIASAEPLFQPVVVGNNLYLPAAAGAILRVDRKTGVTRARITPSGFGATAYVSGPLVADAHGNVYYNVISFADPQPLGTDAPGWLVRVAPDDGVTVKRYDELVTGAPTGQSCHGTFAVANPPPDLPWPPPPNADGSPVEAPLVECGSQRPGINVAPAIAADGAIITVSRAAFTSQDSFVVALNPDLSTRWVTSLRGILNDACGVTVPLDGDPDNQPFDCRPGTTVGVDRNTNLPPAGRVIDESSSSPVALPDGSVLYGAYTSYNGDRGHLVKLDASGKPAATYDFGWDYTPAVWQHDGTYSIVVKDNHYNFDPDRMVDLGPYYITQLDADLKVEWRFQNTNTQSCSYDARHQLHCVADHPNGFEWCINAPAIDANGTIYAGGEDGVVYAIGQGGVDAGHLFLSMSLGASYTPLSIDHAGRLYQQNDGLLSVVGN
jgi:outer membrane protein assembly factor BamB